MKYNTAPTGFTLIELLIYIALVSGVIIAATSFAWTIIDSRSRSFTAQEVEQNSRFMIERISRTVRGGQSITVPAAGASGNQLTVTMRDSEADSINIYLSGDTLYWQSGGGDPIALHADEVLVTDATFTNMSTADGRSTHLYLGLTVSHYNPDNQPAYRYTKTIPITIELRDS